MNRFLLLVVFLITLSVSSPAQTKNIGDTNIDNAKEVEAIKKVIMSGAEAWNKQDVKTYAAQLADDVDFVNVRGGWAKGKSETVEGHERILNTVIKNSYLKVEVLKVRFIKPDVALAHGTVEMYSRTPEGNPGELMQKNLMSQVLVKNSSGQWLVTAFQNTKVDASFAPPRQ